jgi:hypothetical protein
MDMMVVVVRWCGIGLAVALICRYTFAPDLEMISCFNARTYMQLQGDTVTHTIA